MKKTCLTLSFLCAVAIFFSPKMMQTADAYFEQQLLTVIVTSIGLATFSMLFLVLALRKK
ncbi:hypothetical protein ACJYYY_07100 [Brochothrix campestris]|uniref:hypothetical protein n=1 Tax=Brochothrix campestris TaxID=2757 RepID=UPI0038CF662C